MRTSGGETLDFIEIPEIRYQGALIRVPAKVAKQLAKGDEKIALLDDVMTIRPQSSYASRIGPDGPQPGKPPPASLPIVP